MTKLDHALALAAQGFHIFPLAPGAKAPPLIKNFPTAASRDEDEIREWWTEWPTANIGISTSRFGDDEALLVVDVDKKGGKDGNTELLRLELDGWELPETYEQITPTGGRHLVFSVGTSVRQGVDCLGPGLDIRSSGGYVVGRGSCIGTSIYQSQTRSVAPAPDWLISRCGSARHVDRTDNPIEKRPPEAINPVTATARATQYLQQDAPLAIEGQGGDQTTYQVAARCKDFGLSEADTVLLLLTEWNPRCQPPWDPEALEEKVAHAYTYGRDPIGVSAPELDFPIPPPTGNPKINGHDALHPYQEMNREHAFVLAGGGAHILWETTDATGRYKLEHLALSAFQAKFAPQTISFGDKPRPLADCWLKAKERRAYDGLVFLPSQQAPSRFYNLWRGFAYEPAPRYESHPAVESFLDHVRTNVCGGHDDLCRWLLGYCAHLIQRPWEKPLVALVFRGAKGVGKNAFIERIGALLGGHFLLTSNRRYLLGNFNGHLENCLLFALDEAFWSGDHQAEGALKDLITGREHVIEHKGKEPYTVSNKTRVVIIGNEDWLVPASHDERRFAVFTVGDGRKQDRQFFSTMREGLEQRGGYPALLRYLLNYNITGIDVNAAPTTAGLHEQKTHSLNPFHQWWGDSLEEGTLLGSEWGAWPTESVCERVRAAFRRYVKERNIRSRIPEDRAIGRLLKQCAPGVIKKRATRTEEGQPYLYQFPVLEQARAEWEHFMGHKLVWE